MIFNADSLEITTGATDLILAVASGFCALKIAADKNQDERRRRFWTVLFFSLASASFFGAIVHGLQWNKWQQHLWWAPINLSICLVMACFIAVAEHDRRAGNSLSQFIAILFGIFAALGLAANALTKPLYLLLPVEALALLYVMRIYWRLSKSGHAAARWMLMGLAITFVAGITQAFPALHFILVWSFDRRGIFHLLQLIALPFFLKAAQFFKTAACET